MKSLSVQAAEERRVLEVGRRQVDVAEVPADVGPGQVGAAQVGTREVDPRHRHPGEVGTGQVDVRAEQVPGGDTQAYGRSVGDPITPPVRTPVSTAE